MPYYISPAPAARVFTQAQPVFTFHARAARFHPLRRSGKKPSPAGQNARGIQSPGRTPANSPGWSIEDAEPRVKPNNKQSPGRGGRKHSISILLRFLSPVSRAPINFLCGPGAAPAARAYPCLSSFTRFRGLRIRRAFARGLGN